MAVTLSFYADSAAEMHEFLSGIDVPLKVNIAPAGQGEIAPPVVTPERISPMQAPVQKTDEIAQAHAQAKEYAEAPGPESEIPDPVETLNSEEIEDSPTKMRGKPAEEKALEIIDEVVACGDLEALNQVVGRHAEALAALPKFRLEEVKKAVGEQRDSLTYIAGPGDTLNPDPAAQVESFSDQVESHSAPSQTPQQTPQGELTEDHCREALQVAIGTLGFPVASKRVKALGYNSAVDVPNNQDARRAFIEAMQAPA